MAGRRKEPVQYKLTITKESTDAEITERICRAYLKEEHNAMVRAVKDGFETLEPVWQQILAKRRKDLDNARNNYLQGMT